MVPGPGHGDPSLSTRRVLVGAAGRCSSAPAAAVSGGAPSGTTGVQQTG
ncbi:hypothetical protein SFR_3449 [Streptomyces sp. FR-008]|nr:hypothetical protein SFR_3449 [Streptomyces sp. FR-008]